MVAAESKLSEAVAAEGGDKFDVENVAGVENVIEMDIAVMKDEEELERSWTSDSEDDSSPSPSENSFTSDTDISSSSTCSSSSCDESSSNNKKWVVLENFEIIPILYFSNKKRPLIEEMSSNTSSSNEVNNPCKSIRKSWKLYCIALIAKFYM